MFYFTRVLLVIFVMQSLLFASTNKEKKLAYIVSDISIPFWEIMSKGIKSQAKELGYKVEILSSNNDKKTELSSVAKAIQDNVDGIIISPITSSSCVTVLKLAKNANIPVVISDIGTDNGEYLSFISSNNFDGAYNLGLTLAKTMKDKNIADGSVGIISIPQQRTNGKQRTAGFVKALDEYGIKTADIKQQVDFSYEETYLFSKELILKYPNIKALWLQGSDKYQGALDAIKELGYENKILLITFDAEPEFLDMIPKGILVAAGMQQPYLMGEYAVINMDKHKNNQKVDRFIELPVLTVHSLNIDELLPIIQKNVLGIEN